MLGPQPKTLRVTAIRPFQIVLRDDDGQISDRRVIEVGKNAVLDRVLALEMIATGKAVEAAATEVKPAARAAARE